MESYRLNTDFILDGIGTTLTNPTWQLSDEQIDKPISKVVHVQIQFNTGGYYKPLHFVGTYDYSDAGTYEDADLINFVKSIPEFSQSTLIVE